MDYETFQDCSNTGKKAEKLIASLFKEAGFKVINYGYEYTVPELCYKSNEEKRINGPAAEYIRHMPDLVVINSDGKAFFIEVKYRTSSVLADKDLFNYPSCYLVFVTPNGILGQNIGELYKKGSQNLVEINKLAPFRSISQYLIGRYDLKVRRILGEETYLGQIWKYSIKKTGAPRKDATFRTMAQSPCEKCGRLKPRKYRRCLFCLK